MQPILFEWGEFYIPAWHLFYALGAISAYLLMLFLLRRHFQNVITEGQLAGLFMTCYFCGYFGARLLSIVVEEQQPTFLDLITSLGQLGAMTFYGGAIGAVCGGLIYSTLRRLAWSDVFDITIPAGLLALAIGRIGCFLNGDDFGLPVPVPPGQEPPWYAVVIPVLQDDLPRYPVQLVSTGFVGLLTLTLVLNFRKLRSLVGPGVVGLLGVVFYANFRFFIEFWRGDLRGNPFGNWLTTSQVISVLILVICCLSLPYFWRSTSKPSRLQDRGRAT